MSPPLRQFILELLDTQSHGGAWSVEIVVDNARPNRPTLVTTNSSNHPHSSNRWETDEPSTQQGPQGASSTVAALLQRRSPMQAHKNTSPAYPVRKLSPRVHPDGDVAKPTASSSLRMEGKALLKHFDRLAAISRPPLSPKKNGGRLSKAGNQGLEPPLRVLPNVATPPVSKASVPSLPIWTEDEPESSLLEKITSGPTRGLSQTLLGIDFNEQAQAPMIPPIRRPSTQSQEDPGSDAPGAPSRNVATGTHRSINSDCLPLDKKIERDILVLPFPPTPEKELHDDLSSSARATGACSPMLLQRLTKRR